MAAIVSANYTVTEVPDTDVCINCGMPLSSKTLAQCEPCRQFIIETGYNPLPKDWCIRGPEQGYSTYLAFDESQRPRYNTQHPYNDISLRRLAWHSFNTKQNGQSLVEFALFLPILLLIIMGIVEAGAYIIDYNSLLDATREAARFMADGDPDNYSPYYNHLSPWYDSTRTIDCDMTFEFYQTGACYTLALLQSPLHLDNGVDDVILSAYSVRDGVATKVYPYDAPAWSLTGNQESQFDTAWVESKLQSKADPDIYQGIVIVEVYRLHRQMACFPLFTVFVPCELPIHAYTVMPNATAIGGG